MIRFAAILGVGLGLGACVPTATESYLTAPANPRLRVREPVYAPVTAGVKNYEVTGPGDWIEQNRQVAPGGGQGGDSSTNRARRSR